jgi:membrane protein implicated in regulation of membrane protease activity
LVVANVPALLVLLLALLAGWWQAAAFGLAVLVVMDIMVLLRGQLDRSREDGEE